MIDFLKQFIYFIDSIWHYSFLQIGSNSIIVGNIIVASFMVALFLFSHKQVIKKLNSFLHSKTNLDDNLRTLLQNFGKYFLFIIYGIFTLEVAQIPLSIFAFLGGAIVLSIGLGTQNLINNFISGIILMFEKTLKIGDIIEINSITGKVMIIDARSTKIKTLDQQTLIIPNSNLIQDVIIKYDGKNKSLTQSIIFSIDINQSASMEEIKFKSLKSISNIDEIPENSAKIILLSFYNNSAKYKLFFNVKYDQYAKSIEIKNQVSEQLIALFKEQNLQIHHENYNIIKVPS